MLTAEEARALEHDAEVQGTSVDTLMERAGHAVARVAADLAGGAYGRRAVVVCGKGNNAGDGFVAARYLDAWGTGVSVILVSEPGELGEPAATNLKRLEATGVRVIPFSQSRALREFERADVAVDAIFGLGLRGRPRDPFASAMWPFSLYDRPAVSVDIASGVDSDTAAVPGASVHASVTVTFGAPKVGSVLPPGAYQAGRLKVADIGYPEELGVDVDADGQHPWPVTLVEEGDVLVPNPRSPDAHKREAVVLVVAGSRRMTGAPALVAQGAYRAGAGLVTIAVPEGILPIVQGAIREATFLPLPEGTSGSISASAWEMVAERLSDVDAVALGPGLSTEGNTAEFVRKLVRESPAPVVVDADGINAFAGDPEQLADRKGNLVITPHAGELSRLLGLTSDDVSRDPLGAVRAAAAAIRGPVLLKGWRTLVCGPEGRVKVNATGTPILATAGTGDVLSGMITALVARAGEREPPDPRRMDEAAIGGAHVHGLAGRLAGERYGEGTTASDVAEALAEVIRSIHEEMER
ncbi:MAG: NAD(P)H-hydrate dehydratase [Actinomycetota bacterium]|nr:NAD(P)H-hydrate dehydratase [Actinomycetota bacterium]